MVPSARIKPTDTLVRGLIARFQRNIGRMPRVHWLESAMMISIEKRKIGMDQAFNCMPFYNSKGIPEK
jgi:hypothetical protein